MFREFWALSPCLTNYAVENGIFLWVKCLDILLSVELNNNK